MRSRSLIILVLILIFATSAYAINVNTCTGLQTAIKNDNPINLTSDIDCSADPFTNWYYGINGGPNFPSGYTYSQNITGNNFTISNMLINGSGQRRVALLPRTNSSNQFIQDLKINDSQMTSYFSVAGILVAESFSTALIFENVRINNGSIVNQNGGSTGGFIGFGQNVSISKSSFVGYIHSNQSGNSGGAFQGGLIGNSNTNQFNITESFVDVEIIAKDYFGGMIGFVKDVDQNSTIKNSYALATLIATPEAQSNPGGSARTAGLIGYLVNATIQVEKVYTVANVVEDTAVGTFLGTCQLINYTFILDSYTLQNDTTGPFATSFNCNSPSQDFVVNNEQNMKLKSTYDNWDFQNIWGIISGETFPKFRYQFGDSDGDGLLDHEDNLYGNTSDVSASGISGLLLKIDGDSQASINGTYTGLQTVTINSSEGKLLDFDFNFSSRVLNFSKINMTKQSNGFLIHGLDLPDGATKSIYINTNSKGVCVKDAPIKYLIQVIFVMEKMKPYLLIVNA